MIHRFLIAFVFVSLVKTVIAQNDLTDLGNSVNESTQFTDDQNTFQYYKCFGNHILRREYNIIQLIGPDLSIIWEKQLDELRTNGSNKNDFYVSSNDQYVFIIQKGATITVKQKNEAIIHRLTRDGEYFSKDITELTDPIEIVQLQYLNNELVLHYVHSKFMGANKSEVLQFHIIRFDENLNQIGDVVDLPDVNDKNGYNFIWMYEGFYEGKHHYRDHFSIKEGNYSHLGFGSSEYQKMQLLEIDSEFQIVRNEMLDSEFPKSLHGFFHLEDTYDTEKWQLKLKLQDENVEFEIKRNWTHLLTALFESMQLKSSDGKEIQVFEELAKMTSEKGSFRIDQIHENVFNGGLDIFLIKNNKDIFLLHLDDQLNLTHAYTASTAFEYFLLRLKDQNIRFYQKKPGAFYGKNPEGWRTTAQEYAMTSEQKGFRTIINYEDYQLLFIDNKNESTKAVKIAK